VLGLKVLSRKQELRFFGSVPLHFQTYKYGLLCISGATEVLGAIVAVITVEQGRHSRGSGNSTSMPSTSLLFLGQQEEPEKILQARQWTHSV